MYRIVIADDEEYVRELLTKNINQTDNEFEVVGKAENGAQAIELVQELKPDILITDICMPLVSGLELIERIKELDQSVKTVIISGYDDFSYAKQALTLGVTDYLLKPFLPEEMYEVLEKIKNELERQQTLMHNIQEMQTQLENHVAVMQEHFLRKLIENAADIQSAEEEAGKARIDLHASYYSVGILRLESNLEGGGRDLKDFLGLVTETYFPASIRPYVVPMHDRPLAVVFMGDYKNPHSFLRGIREGITSLHDSMEKYYDMRLSCVLGGICPDWNKICDSYQEAMSVWRGILDTEETLICYEEVKNRKADANKWTRPVDLETDLMTSLLMGRKEKAVELLYEILQYYGSLGVEGTEFVSISLVQLVFEISSALKEAAGDQYRVWEDEKVIEYLKEHFAFGSLKEARLILGEYVESCCDQFSGINEKQGDRIVYNVKDLIEKNLDNEEFGLEMASAKLFFSQNYVRQIFKQITGESFTEYLIRRRMETAKELLGSPVCRICDVAARTGYSNQRYFASCFKKYYGCTPTQYRNRVSGEEGGENNG